MLCFFCNEEIEFAPTDEVLAKVIIDNRPVWRHVESGKAACETFATPSNIEVAE